MKIAVEGCCHGELDMIYDTINHIAAKDKIKIDLLICCGDFQAVRNPSDLKCMAVPPKYQKLNTFYKYYNGEKKAPFLTIFIGGNHEASNYLQELPYGGWVAPNIYYLGYAGVVRFGGLRIGGISGIYKSHDYLKGHFEYPPYTDQTKRSVYHTRNLEIFRLKQISDQLDIFISHDWPRGIYDFGCKEKLCKQKRFLADEINKGTLGSPPLEEVLHTIKPKHWFAAHLHAKFAARVQHLGGSETKFLALDKCLPKRQFLQIIELNHNENKNMVLELDPEWLCILKQTNNLLSIRHGYNYMPGSDDKRCKVEISKEDLSNLSEDFNGIFSIPNNFAPTAPFYSQNNPKCYKNPNEPVSYMNPQTSLICMMLGITDPSCQLMGRESPDSEHGEWLNESLNDSKLSDGDESNSCTSNMSKSFEKKVVNKLSFDNPLFSPDKSLHEEISPKNLKRNSDELSVGEESNSITSIVSKNYEKKVVSKLSFDNPLFSPDKSLQEEISPNNLKRDSGGLSAPFSTIDLEEIDTSSTIDSSSFYDKFYSCSDKIAVPDNDTCREIKSTDDGITPLDTSFENYLVDKTPPYTSENKTEFEMALSPISKKHLDNDSPFLNISKDVDISSHKKSSISLFSTNTHLSHFKSSTPFSKTNDLLTNSKEQLPLPSLFKSSNCTIYDTPPRSNDCSVHSSNDECSSPKPNIVEVPKAKKFKRRNESIYTSFDE